MASFILPPTVNEPLYPPGVDEDTSLRIWAFSTRRSPFVTACAFLNVGYNYRHSEAHPMYYIQCVAQQHLTMHFINPLDARLLYGRGYHCDSELYVFTRAYIFTSYQNFFSMGLYIILLRFAEKEQEAPDQ
jgi:hypothetical protein